MTVTTEPGGGFVDTVCPRTWPPQRWTWPASFTTAPRCG